MLLLLLEVVVLIRGVLIVRLHTSVDPNNSTGGAHIIANRPIRLRKDLPARNRRVRGRKVPLLLLLRKMSLTRVPLVIKLRRCRGLWSLMLLILIKRLLVLLVERLLEMLRGLRRRPWRGRGRGRRCRPSVVGPVVIRRHVLAVYHWHPSGVISCPSVALWPWRRRGGGVVSSSPLRRWRGERRGLLILALGAL